MKWLAIIFGGILFLFLAVVAMVLLFYAEENWRGHHVWETTKAELTARGDAVDLAALIPPEVPDDQNLGALPLFQLTPDPEDKDLKPMALKQALANLDADGYKLPSYSKWVQGQTPDSEEVSKGISKQFKKAFKLAPGSREPSTRDELDALCPFTEDIRKASKERPLFRLDQKYGARPAGTMPLGLSTIFIHVAQVFTLHSILALHAGQPEVALDDMRLLFKINAEFRREPLLVSGLVGIGIFAIQNKAIQEGLALHAWNNAQLEDLAQSLRETDFLPAYQVCMRGEAMTFLAPVMDQMEQNYKTADLFGLANQEDSVPEGRMWLAAWYYWMTPRGWFSLAKAKGVRLYYDAADQCVDLQARRVYPARSDHFLEVASARNLFSPGEILRCIAMGVTMNACSKFANAQFQADATQIACRAEQYWLIHKAYPVSLDALSQPRSESLPHDPLTGEPYHYVLQKDGSFQIYSVGWDLKDDGGHVAYKADAPKVTDTLHGDWVWPAPTK